MKDPGRTFWKRQIVDQAVPMERERKAEEVMVERMALSSVCWGLESSVPLALMKDEDTHRLSVFLYRSKDPAKAKTEKNLAAPTNSFWTKVPALLAHERCGWRNAHTS